MIVTKTEAVSKNKYKIEIDGAFAFVLYRGELSRYQICEGSSISEELCQQIKTEVILRRAKLRAMHLLNDMDRTEAQLRRKLSQNLYPEDVVEEAMSYVKSFGYIDDLGYAKRYVQSRQGQKSRRELYAKLADKGIAWELIDLAIEECYEGDDETETIRRMAAKRKYRFQDATREEQQKQAAYFMRKGFSYENIRKALQSDEIGF